MRSMQRLFVVVLSCHPPMATAAESLAPLFPIVTNAQIETVAASDDANGELFSIEGKKLEAKAREQLMANNLPAALESLKALEEQATSNRPQIYNLHFAIGDAALREKDYATCQSSYNAAVRIVRVAYGPTSSEYVELLLRIASLRSRQERWIESEAIFKQVLEVTKDRYFTEKHLRAYACVGLAEVYLHYDVPETALNLVEHARAHLPHDTVEIRSLRDAADDLEARINRRIANRGAAEDCTGQRAETGDCESLSPAKLQELKELHHDVKTSLFEGHLLAARDHQEAVWSFRESNSATTGMLANFDRLLLVELREVAAKDHSAHLAYVQGFRRAKTDVMPEYEKLQPDYRALDGPTEDAIASYKEALGRDSVQSVNLYGVLAAVASNNKEYERAIECHMKAVELDRQLVSENHPMVSGRIYSIAAIRMSQEKWGEAEQLLRTAAKGLRRDAASSQVVELPLTHAFAKLAMTKCESIDAEAMCFKGLRITEGKSDQSYVVIRVEFYAYLGEIAYSFGEMESADNFFQRAMAVCDAYNITTMKSMARGLPIHAKVLEQLGRHAEARAMAGRAIDMLPDSAKEKVK